MWGGFKSIFGQYYTKEEENVLHPKVSDNIEGGWVLVDIEGNEIDPEQPTPNPTFSSCLSPLPLLDISNASTPQSSPQLSPTKIEEGWFVAPPPCFTRNSPDKIEISPLEDLLIEHPSMSVYARLPGFQPKKEVLLPQAGLPATDNAAKRTKELRREQRPLASYQKPKGASPVAKTQLDLKNFIDQVENTKPSQQAKWESDQYKLCPSYLSRQNRVHRYQSRKHQNQKKKSLAKPFAEKGKHGF